MEDDYYEIDIVCVKDLPNTLSRFRGCWKTCSILWMRAMGFPVLSGVIISQWSRRAAAAVEDFCRRSSFSELLLRVEEPGQRWTKRRGGYLVRLEQVGGVVDEVAGEGLITILLEPASPYSDHYSLTAVVDSVQAKVDIEIVGPGFDASDMLRQDLLPHERFELPIAKLRSPRLDYSGLKRTFLITNGDYQESVQARLAKIGAKLENAAYPDGLHSSGATRAALASKGKQFLIDSRQPLLLDNLNTYAPISRDQLEDFLRWVGKLIRLLDEDSVDLGTFALAGGVLQSRGLRMWDFYPAGNLDTALLSPLACHEGQ